MAIVLSSDIRKLVDRANFAHLATLMNDGSPHSAPVWIAREGDLILISTSGVSVKARNTQRDRRVSLSIVDFRDPYEEVQIRGRVVEQRPDAQFKYLDAVSQKYTGKNWPYREEKEPIVLVIEVLKAKYAKQPFKHTPPSS
jgi:PPOX class probable F420-dependent enzyme